MSTLEDRLTALETKFAYLEDFMNALQAMTVEHSETIDRLKGDLRQLKDKMGAIEDAVQDMPHTRPPHY